MMRLRRARELAGLSIGQAAKLLGWSQGPLVLMEKGHGHPPDPGELGRLASLYGVSVEWLRGDEVQLSDDHRMLVGEIEHDGDRARVAELLASLPRRGR